MSLIVQAKVILFASHYQMHRVCSLFYNLPFRAAFIFTKIINMRTSKKRLLLFVVLLIGINYIASAQLEDAKKAIAASNARYFSSFVKNVSSIFINSYAEDACILAPNSFKSSISRGQHRLAAAFHSVADAIGSRLHSSRRFRR